MTKNTPIPKEINLHQKSRVLELTFDTGEQFELSCEYLRVYSPSAEVRGHGPGEETLQIGKADVNIDKIEPVGTYAIQLSFDDGHDTGIYSWDWLYHISKNHEKLWQTYLDKMEKAGEKRAPTSAG
ncbi:1-(5-phosphoribosyl)-5-[(5-phosphoribosylamino)methylideneamino] imidazole-4-carboxamide isomerase [Candidatus Thiomargarita nelsonii]|uniref:1-(5-phosphoribosyl)-5-[(5-phosphoribosylamino)methylideneamino] imidazole-4-carboxamide isomerase n=1 Tax=Candidatus Thiomargarita nelsonii TaxID=1003181 RepID=A0A4E0QT36_9GAMM|nr:1-(5-phosphoribosyl)-5-[(5-phosphoribosylamino)methylideneamino] imidazole-4-carboxamide isomerase [Candidatus Thiomargarita nelsonii]